MKEQMYGESFVPERENAKRLKYTLDRLKEYEHFINSPFVSHIIEIEGKLSRKDQERMRRSSENFKNSISEDFKNNGELLVKEDNHLAHILGNSILTSADGFARNFEQGKYSIGENRYFIETETGKMVPMEFLSQKEQEDIKEKIKAGARFVEDKNNSKYWTLKENFDFDNEIRRRKFPELPKEKIDGIVGEINLLNYYINEVSQDPEMAKTELLSKKGMLENYLEYLKCDLPNQSPRRIELIRFFRDIEKGEVNENNLEEKTKNLQDLLDIEVIKKKWDI